jgi:hypothetical protein
MDLTPKNILWKVFFQTLQMMFGPLVILAALNDCRTDQTQTGGHLNVRIFEQAEPRTQ